MNNIIELSSYIKSKNNINIIKISKYFINKLELTPKKLQKLCFYAYAHYYATNNKKLFKAEFVESVQGVINKELDNYYKDYKFKIIPSSDLPTLNTEIEVFLNLIIKKYGDLTAGQLEDLSLSEIPIKNARKGLYSFQSKSNKINDKDIINYYKLKSK